MKAACLSCGRKNNLSGRSSKWSFCLLPRYRYTGPICGWLCASFFVDTFMTKFPNDGSSHHDHWRRRKQRTIPASSVCTATCLTTKEDRRHQANAISNKAVAFLPVSFAQLEINPFRLYQEDTSSMEQQVWREIYIYIYIGCWDIIGHVTLFDRCADFKPVTDRPPTTVDGGGSKHGIGLPLPDGRKNTIHSAPSYQSFVVATYLLHNTKRSMTTTNTTSPNTAVASLRVPVRSRNCTRRSVILHMESDGYDILGPEYYPVGLKTGLASKLYPTV